MIRELIRRWRLRGTTTWVELPFTLSGPGDPGPIPLVDRVTGDPVTEYRNARLWRRVR
jgi:hypothetical protein